MPESRPAPNNRGGIFDLRHLKVKTESRRFLKKAQPWALKRYMSRDFGNAVNPWQALGV